MRFLETESRRAGAGAEGIGLGSGCVMGTELPFGDTEWLWGWMVGAMAVQQGECT